MIEEIIPRRMLLLCGCAALEARGDLQRLDVAIRMAQAAGYTDLNAAIAEGKKLAPGAKLYQVQMGKAVMTECVAHLLNSNTNPTASNQAAIQIDCIISGLS